MFDFAWSELALIGVVALVAIGPKDMPVAIKNVAKLVKKARGMAGEFQGHLDELMKEADLGEMRGHLSELRSFNIRDTVTRAVDPDGSLRAGMADRPFTATRQMPAVDPVTGLPVEETVPETLGAAREVSAHPAFSMAPEPPRTGFMPRYYAPPPDHLRPALETPPAFIPPEAVAAEGRLRAAPAFIPPEFAGLGPH